MRSQTRNNNNNNRNNNNSNRPPGYSNEHVEEEVPFIWRGSLEDALMQACQSSEPEQIFELKFSLFKYTFANIINHIILNLFLYLLIQNQFEIDYSTLDLIFYIVTGALILYHIIWFIIVSYKLNHSQFYLNRNYYEYSRPDAIFYGISNPDLCSPPPEYTPILGQNQQPPGYGSLIDNSNDNGSGSGSGSVRNTGNNNR